MTRIDLRIEKAKGDPLCIGSGFVSLDIIQGKAGSFSAAGGSCGNVMAILAWLGWKARPSTRLGADTAGDFVLGALRDAGVDPVHLLKDGSVSTPVVIQRFVEDVAGQRTHRFYLSCPNCGAWLPRFRATKKEQVAPIMDGPVPNAFYFDRVSPSSLDLASWTAQSGGLVLFEPSSIGDERTFQMAIGTCHVLKYAKDRLGHVPDLAAVKHPRLIIETCGADGLKVRWRGRWSHFPAFRVPVFVDAAGSGDWCSAGLIHQIARRGPINWAELSKTDIERGLRTGQAMAAINCRFEGARGSMTALTSLRSFNDALHAVVKMPVRDIDLSLHHVDPPEPPAGFCKACLRDKDKLIRSSSPEEKEKTARDRSDGWLNAIEAKAAGS